MSKFVYVIDEKDVAKERREREKILEKENERGKNLGEGR